MNDRLPWGGVLVVMSRLVEDYGSWLVSSWGTTSYGTYYRMAKVLGRICNQHFNHTVAIATRLGGFETNLLQLSPTDHQLPDAHQSCASLVDNFPSWVQEGPGL